MAYQRQQKTYKNADHRAILARITPSTLQTSIIRAVTHGTGDLSIRALAGTGKTTTLELIVATLHTIARADSILVCAFSNEIKDELETRLHGLAEIKTTYQLGFRAVREFFNFPHLEISNFKYRDYARDLASGINQDLAYDLPEGAIVPSETEITTALAKLCRQCQLSLVDPRDVQAVESLIDHFDIDLPIDGKTAGKCVFKMFERGKIDARKGLPISFEDMVWLPAVFNMPCRTYNVVLIDEAQDLNAAQRAVVLRSRTARGRVIFVGDPNQAIFGFAGADDRSFDAFLEATSAIELPLNVCYRCPKEVLRHAQRIVPDIMPTTDAPDGIVSEAPESDLPTILRDGDMVLCRKTAPLVKLCLSLIANRRKAQLKGRDVGAYLIDFIKNVAKQEIPGMQFEYLRMGEFIDAYTKRMLERAGEDEGKIQKIIDTANAVRACFENFTESRNLDSLTKAIAGIFVDSVQPGIMLSTVHRAKGLEAERIFILEPESLPLIWKGQQAWEFQQELNLQYVAYTRAKYNRKTGHTGAMYFVTKYAAPIDNGVDIEF